MDIKRYDNDEGDSEMYEVGDGQFVLYKDHCETMEAQRATHLAIVEKLKVEVEQLALGRLEESYDTIYHEGYNDGWKDAKQFLVFD